MEFQFLGTSSGTPTRARNVSALALRLPAWRHWSLVDCGEGTQHRVLRTSLSLRDLRAVFVTHLHGDHCYGLPGLLASAGLLNRSEPLVVAGPAPLRRFLEGVMETTALRLPYALEFIDVEALEEGLLPESVLPDLIVRATPLSHRLPCWAYSFTEREVERKLDADRLRAGGVAPGAAWGAIQRGQDVTLPDGRRLAAADYLLAPRRPRTVVVGGDNDRPELLLEQACAADVLVHEATYTEDVLRRIGPGPQHSSAAMVARMAAEAGVPNLVLTHFSPRYQDAGSPSLDDLAAEARALYGGELFLAQDFDHYLLDRHGRLSRVEGRPRAMPSPAAGA